MAHIRQKSIFQVTGIFQSFECFFQLKIFGSVLLKLVFKLLCTVLNLRFELLSLLLHFKLKCTEFVLLSDIFFFQLMAETQHQHHTNW